MTLHDDRPSETPFDHLDDRTRDFYLRSLDILDRVAVPFVIGGAYALAYHTGIVRHTKDLDAFLKEDDLPRALRAFEAAGYKTDVTHPHWIAKAFSDEDAFVDLIFASGNGVSCVDDEWFAHAIDGEVFERPVKICPAEEIIWSKSFVQERNRFDGADINHLLLARADTLDWCRLLNRFGDDHFPVLLAHLTLFTYVYPSEKDRIPAWVLDELFARQRATPPAADPLCRGTLLSWEQYLPDIRDNDFKDARITPHGQLTKKEVRRWTNAEK